MGVDGRKDRKSKRTTFGMRGTLASKESLKQGRLRRQGGEKSALPRSNGRVADFGVKSGARAGTYAPPGEPATGRASSAPAGRTGSLAAPVLSPPSLGETRAPRRTPAARVPGRSAGNKACSPLWVRIRSPGTFRCRPSSPSAMWWPETCRPTGRGSGNGLVAYEVGAGGAWYRRLRAIRTTPPGSWST
jgi:hypothetical protein